MYKLCFSLNCVPLNPDPRNQMNADATGNRSVSGSTSLRTLAHTSIFFRNRVYYLSLAFGFGGAACFLMLTMLGKLLYYLLWNYGCCLCCSCCKNQLPPKTKKLTKASAEGILAFWQFLGKPQKCSFFKWSDH